MATAAALNMRDEMKRDLTERILPFWMKHAVDDRYGGFLGEVGADLAPDYSADKTLVLNPRILWTFSAAYRIFGDAAWLKVADRAYAFLTEHFQDREYGGMYWSVDAAGKPKDKLKHMYGQAFAIYGLSEYVRVTQNQSALEAAVAIFRLMNKHSFDPVNGGYFDIRTREWGSYKSTGSDVVSGQSPKSMNTHLHILEAFTCLYRVWQAPEMAEKLEHMIGIMTDKVLNRPERHFDLFFDEAWRSEGDPVSYGHDIEGSWLIWEAAEVLNKPDVLEKVKPLSIGMCLEAYEKGYDREHGGIFYELHPDGKLEDYKSWWPQAEAVVGYFNGWQLTGKEELLNAALHSWQFTKEHLWDPSGEWITGTDRSGKPSGRLPLVTGWKCPYHNGRACMEIVERLADGHGTGSH